jgi:hypothetical protein
LLISTPFFFRLTEAASKQAYPKGSAFQTTPPVFHGSVIDEGEDEVKEGKSTLESLLANHGSLNVTNELEVDPPFASGLLAEVRNGHWRNRKAFRDVIFIFDAAKIFSGLRQSPEGAYVREMEGRCQYWSIQQIGMRFVLIAYFEALARV